MDDERKCKRISEFEKLAAQFGLEIRLKRPKGKDRNGDVVCDTPITSDRSVTALTSAVKAGSDTEEGEIIASPDAQAESKQQYSDGSPPRTEENVADHKAVSNNLRKRKQVHCTTCRICGKSFPSMKSLYGHMRCHERNWKGVSPPPEENRPVPIPATDPDSSNTVLPQSNSSVNAKRSGKEKAAANPEYEEESEDPVINAARILMLLANEGFSPDSTARRQQQNGNINVNSAQMDVDKAEGSNRNYKCEPTEKMDDLEMVTDLAPEGHKQYVCSICNKSFSSPQALGGHTASHSKGKSNSGAGGTEEAKVEQTEGGGLPTRVHQCNICGLAFPTGQALGGHKRKHWPGPENFVAPSSENAENASNPPENFVAPSAEIAEKASDPRLDFDLNEPAPPED